MNCLRAEELFSDDSLGELHPLLRGELSEHLGSCEECAALAEALGEVMEVLRAASRRLRPSEVEPAAKAVPAPGENAATPNTARAKTMN